MRPGSPARGAGAAEGGRVRAGATRIVPPVVYAAIALVSLLGALTFAHIAAWYGTRPGLQVTPIATAGVLGGIDLLIAIILGLLARRSTPSRVEREALQVRQEAVANLRSAVNVTQVALPLLRFAVPLARRRRRREPHGTGQRNAAATSYRLRRANDGATPPTACAPPSPPPSRAASAASGGARTAPTAPRGRS